MGRFSGRAASKRVPPFLVPGPLFGGVLLSRQHGEECQEPTGSNTLTCKEMVPITSETNDQTTQSPSSVRVLINNVNGLPHIYQVLATAMIGAGITLFGYGLAQTEAAEAAAVLLTAFLLTFTRLIIDFKPPQDESADFAQTRTVIANFIQETKEMIRTRAVLGKAIIAFFSAVVFLVCRWAALFLFEYLANPWIALGFGALLTSLICSPLLWKALQGSLASKTQ